MTVNIRSTPAGATRATGAAAARQDRRAARGRRIRALLGPEALLGALIVAFWGVVGPVHLVAPWVVFGTVLVGLAVHVASVDGGDFSLLWLTTGWLLLLIGVWVRRSTGELDPLVLVAAGSSALAHGELVRLAHARRRNASVDRSAHGSSATGLGLAALLAAVGVGLGDVLAGAVGASRLWLPAAVVVVATVAVAIVVVPTIGAPAPHRDRWQPGDRIPPHRRG